MLGPRQADRQTDRRSETCLPRTENKTILVTGRGVPQSCEESKLEHFLGDRVTDSVNVFGLNPRKNRRYNIGTN
jgi:hypothetical protein